MKKAKHFHAYWRPTILHDRVQVWSFAARDMDEAEQTIRDVVLMVPAATRVDVESDDGTERKTVSK